MEELNHIIKKDLEVLRAIAVKLRHKGLANQEVAALLDVAESFVSLWYTNYEKEGVTILKPAYKGSKSYLSEEIEKDIILYIKNKENIIVEELIDYMKSNYNIEYKSLESYYALLKKGGMSWHRTTKSNPKKDLEKIEVQREEIKKKVDSHLEEIKKGEIQLFCEDESHLVHGQVCGWAWGPKNEKIEIPMENPKARQTYYGSFNLFNGSFHVQPQSAGNGSNTISHIKYLESLYPNSKIWILWDGAKYHVGKEVKAYLESVNQGLEEKDWKIRLFKFAPNAPEQNPVENIWGTAKNFLRRTFFKNKNFEEVKNSFFNFLNDNIFSSKKVTWYLNLDD